MLAETADLSLDEMLAGSPFISYSYSYPHKTAYRPLEPRVALSRLWAEERRESLFLYVHIPFCEMRCGFCNLFALSQPGAELPKRYLDAIRRQAEAVRPALGDARFARLAIGGGTPTFLSVEELQQLFGTVREVLGVEPRQIPVSVEASPATVSEEKLALLREAGVDRVSLGVQSFDDHDAGAIRRPQRRSEVERALGAIRAAGFPTLNIDLIYGGEGQTVGSWLASVREALVYEPQELYLYPLYVRPLTGLGRRDRDWDDQRLTAYRQARGRLLESGYQQVSMRMFRRPDAPGDSGPVYCCQQDGMLGLGCGAESYTRELHYSREYAVRPGAVSGILEDFIQRDRAAFAFADHGYWLDREDQQRRYVILSLLSAEGLSSAEYARQFASDPFLDLPELCQLESRGLAEARARLCLTPAGLEWSDAIGPWLNSHKARRLMESYPWR